MLDCFQHWAENQNLKISFMTFSAKGTQEKPDNKVKQKTDLYRTWLNVSFHKVRERREYKAKNLGSKIVRVVPKGSSQTCLKGVTSPKAIEINKISTNVRNLRMRQIQM